jgi:hypothetical protein
MHSPPRSRPSRQRHAPVTCRFWDDGGVAEEAGAGHEAADSGGERVSDVALGDARPVSAMVGLLSSMSLLMNLAPMILRLQVTPCLTESW